MFDIGTGEVALIAVIALLVLGPDRLPGAARTAGALLRKARQSWNNVRDEIERELQAEELKQSMKKAAQELDPRAGLQELRTTVEEHTTLTPSQSPTTPPAADNEQR
ncbi:MAG: Sec-independent protein translocase protein TatB [Rudaea sp.]